jgi:Delta7-sterol 5-desaturase
MSFDLTSLAELLWDVWGSIWHQWIFSLVAFALIYGAFRGYFRQRKIQGRPWSWKIFRYEVLFSALGLGIGGTCVGKLTGYLVDVGIASIDEGPVTLAALPTIAWQFALYVVLFDIYFYFLHRLMHTDLLWWIHRHHHVSESPDPLTAFSFHPVEAFITGGFVPLMLIFFNLHLASVIAVNLYGILNSVAVHSGHEIFPRWWYRGRISRFYISPMYHDRHHSLYHYNFGAFTNIWDRLFGTMAPSFEADYEALRGAKNPNAPAGASA